MGIFDFLKAVGKKLSGASEAVAPKAEDLKAELDSFNLGTEGVTVSVDGDKVILGGTVKDQSTFEKAVLAVGNSMGVAQVSTDNLAVEQAGSQPVFYTVKPGDNLWKIAEASYGKGQGGKNTIIFEANKPMLTSPDKIYPGQVLRIPPMI